MHDAALDRGRTPMTNEIVGGRVVDADCHILEPPDIWENWLPSKYEDKAPKLVKDAEGGDAWLTAVGGEPDPIGLVSTPGMPFDKFRWFGVTYEEARAGCYNGAERLKDMDIDGVDAEILFPPQRTMSHFLGDDDDDFVLIGGKPTCQLFADAVGATNDDDTAVVVHYGAFWLIRDFR